MRRRAVLTGGAGFVGSHLAERLLDDGVEVLSPIAVEHLVGRNGVRLLKVDVSDYPSVPGPVDYVLHFASPASAVDDAQLPIETLKAGSLGMLRSLRLAKKKGARFLPQPESYWGNVNPVGPRACCDVAKRFAEALTMSYRAKHKVNTAIMRICNIYGPRMRPYDGRGIPNFVNQALAGMPKTVQGGGSQTRSFCDVGDFVGGAVRLLYSDLAGPVNFGNPVELTGSDSPVEFVPRAQDVPTQRYDRVVATLPAEFDSGCLTGGFL